MASNNIGSTVSIATASDGTTPDPQTDADLPLSGSEFAALTWTEVPNVGTHGDTGVDQNMTQYDTWGNTLSTKTKGIATGKDAEIRVLDEASNGLTALKAAASPTDNNNYAFRIVKSNGDIEYNAGRVSAAGYSKGGPEDYSEAYFTIGLNQEPVFA